MTKETKLTAKEFIDQYPKAIPEKRVDWEGAMVDYAYYCLNHPAAPLSSIGKTDETGWTYREVEYDRGYAQAVYDPSGNVCIEGIGTEEAELICDKFNRLAALSEGKTETKESIYGQMTNDTIIAEVFNHDYSDLHPKLHRALNMVRESISAKTAIPKSLNECRLTERELAKYYGWSYPVQIARDIEEIIFEKFAAYLGKTAKELPSVGELKEIVGKYRDNGETDHEIAAEIHKVFSSRASEALRQKDEQIEKFRRSVGRSGEDYLLEIARKDRHIQSLKSDLAAKEKQGKEFAEWASNNDWKFYKTTWSIWIKDGEQKTTDKLFTLFLSAPPLGEKGKE